MRVDLSPEMRQRSRGMGCRRGDCAGAHQLLDVGGLFICVTSLVFMLWVALSLILQRRWQASLLGL